jgi:dTDP-4-amino-4,6-dideoxygalactose transaminase
VSQHAVAVNFATAALSLALEAIGLPEWDELLVATMAFAATKVHAAPDTY